MAGPRSRAYCNSAIREGEVVTASDGQQETSVFAGKPQQRPKFDFSPGSTAAHGSLPFRRRGVLAFRELRGVVGGNA
jgi:hypothetical protein